MGAWGTGVFEDDTSCDLLCDALEDDAKKFIQETISSQDAEYLEYTEGHAFIVSGVIADSILNQASYDHETEGFDEWMDQQQPDSLLEFVPDIVTGLKRVISEDSELNELWQENEEEYPEWKSNIEEIITALT